MAKSWPSRPVLQLLTARRTAPTPRHFVPVTYISRDELMSLVRRADAPSSPGGYFDPSDPLNSTMLSGTMAEALPDRLRRV